MRVYDYNGQLVAQLTEVDGVLLRAVNRPLELTSKPFDLTVEVKVRSQPVVRNRVVLPNHA